MYENKPKIAIRSPAFWMYGCAYVQYGAGAEQEIPLGGGEGHFGLGTLTLIIINAKLHTNCSVLLQLYGWGLQLG